MLRSSSIYLYLLSLVLLSFACPSLANKCYDECMLYTSGGFVWIRNKGLYLARFQLSGDLKNGTSFCCTSGDFAADVNQVIPIPFNSRKLEMTAEDEAFPGIWSTIFKTQYSTSDTQICYEISGSTISPEYTVVKCFE